MPPTAPDSRLGKRYRRDEGLDLVSLPEVRGGAALGLPASGWGRGSTWSPCLRLGEGRLMPHLESVLSHSCPCTTHRLISLAGECLFSFSRGPHSVLLASRNLAAVLTLLLWL